MDKNLYVIKTVKAPSDLNCRAAVTMTYSANQFKEYIRVQRCDNEDRCVNAKSLLGVLSLGVHKGDLINIIITKEENTTEDVIKHLLDEMFDGGVYEYEEFN